MARERFAWFELASHLGMSLQRCQRETTSTEFAEWIEYLELKEKSRIDYWYWAQIACEIRRSWSSKPKMVKIKTFLLNFATKKRTTKLSKEEYTKRMKAKWFSIIGYKPKD